MRAGLEWHEDLENVCLQAGLKGRKIVKVRSIDLSDKCIEFSLSSILFDLEIYSAFQ